MSERRGVVQRGVIAGVLAATTVVLLFFVVDLVRGDALRTPAFLASVLFGREAVTAGFWIISLYTAVHYAIFSVVGVTAAWALDRLAAPPSLLLGLVLGFLLFDAVFYAGVILTGVNVVNVVGWPSFLAGNLMAGLALMGYLRRGAPATRRGWAEVLAEHRVLREGLVAGVIGAAAVAAWFFFIDLAAGRLLYTPAALGGAIFGGVDAPGAVEATVGTILGYTGVHVVGFIAMGMVFSGLINQAERTPTMVMGLALLFVTFEALLLGMITIVATWLLDVLPWWSVTLANLIAAGAMAGYLWRAHPALRAVEYRPDDAAAGVEGADREPAPHEPKRQGAR